jgi:hypothetical protein
VCDIYNARNPDGTLEYQKMLNVNEKQTEMHCFPLYSIMAAIEQTNIDFFSLDVGGKDELSVLQALPFSELNINMMAFRKKTIPPPGR